VDEIQLRMGATGKRRSTRRGREGGKGEEGINTEAGLVGVNIKRRVNKGECDFQNEDQYP